jgi:hypothetical protein
MWRLLLLLTCPYATGRGIETTIGRTCAYPIGIRPQGHVTKGVLAYTAGGRGFAIRVVPGLVLMFAALWVAFLI